MNEHNYRHVHATLDPDQLEEYPNGVRVQEIELILGGDPELPSWRASPPARLTVDARRARELAFELLTLAELAEQLQRTEDRR